MIEVGLIANGPELRRKPIVKEIRRLREVLAATKGGPSIELAFVVPGRLGQPDFDGFEMGRRRGQNAREIVFIAVPSELAESASPMAGLVQLGQQAIDFARSGSEATNFDQLKVELTQAASRLNLGTDHESRDPVPRSTRSAPARRAADLEMEVQVTLPIRDPATLDDAYKVEAALQDRLEPSGLGYVDGNEVGEGSFVVFIYGPPSEALVGAVDDVVRTQWVHGESHVEVDTAGSGSP